MRALKYQVDKAKAYDMLMDELRLLMQLPIQTRSDICRKAGISNTTLIKYIKEKESISHHTLTSLIRYIIEESNYLTVCNLDLQERLIEKTLK